MSSEQSCKFKVSIKSGVLGEILKRHDDLMRNINGKVEITYSGVSIAIDNDFYFTGIPEKKEDVVGAFCHVLKDALGKESKAIIKDIKKAKKAINVEAVSDWDYVDTCVGELAKDMARDKVEPHELVNVEKYIYEITFKDGKYLWNEYPVFKEE